MFPVFRSGQKPATATRADEERRRRRMEKVCELIMYIHTE